jgi:hypothetical protein
VKGEKMTTTATTNEKTETTGTIVQTIGINKLTAKRVTLAVGSLGFALCFSGLLWGTRAFAIGFLVMLISAFAYTRLNNQ